MTSNDAIPIQVVRDNLRRWTDSGKACDSLEELCGGCRFALLVEASHGTHEFYQTRAEITERLIREKGFSAVAVEADWPDAYRVNRYVQGRDQDADAAGALSPFKRFPAWMWRNADVADFIGTRSIGVRSSTREELVCSLSRSREPTVGDTVATGNRSLPGLRAFFLVLWPWWLKSSLGGGFPAHP